MKLTRYISLRFIGVAALIMALSIPAFYFVIEKIMQENVDESLRYQKEWLLNKIQHEDPKNFSKYSRNIAVREVQDILRTSDAFNTKNIYIENDDEFVNHRVLDFYKEINGKKYHFKIRKSLVENEDVLESVALLQGILFLTLLLALLIINRNVEKKVWKPFYGMLDSLNRYRIDHHNFEKQPDAPVKELNLLNASLADLTERNRKLYTAQKEFTENASHELQTPLAVIQNKLEMLMQTEPLTETQIRYIADLYETNQKIARLNKSLLLLAKIENNQFEGLQEISLKTITEKTLENLEFSIDEKNIEVKTDGEKDKKIWANENLIQILLGNLISNAIKYADINGKIQLNFTGTFFEIGNTSAFGKLNEEKLFERFQKQNTGNESNGLGLEISRKICELYSWNLKYDYRNSQHFFKINFN